MACGGCRGAIRSGRAGTIPCRRKESGETKEMNKQEKIIAMLLGLCLVAWLWHSVNEQKKAAEAARR